ncbi:MAG: hypothetical protein ABIR84_05575 [Candidatus Nitrotoga sp.]
MNTTSFFKIQIFAIIFAAITSPLSAIAGQQKIEFALGTYEKISYTKETCLPFKIGGTITGIGTGSITNKNKNKSLGLLILKADDCITPLNMEFTRFHSDGNLTLTAGKGNKIMAEYSVDFILTETESVYKYENFNLKNIRGTGDFEGVSGSGTAGGTSNIQTGLGFVEGILNISN